MVKVHAAITAVGGYVPEDKLTNEDLAKIYLKKQLDTFGMDHPKSKDIALYYDEKGVVLLL